MTNNSHNANETGFQVLNATTGVYNGRTLQQGTGITITNANGTGGDPTITATGGDPTADALGTVYLVDDFIYFIDGTTGDTNWKGDNAIGTQTNSVAGHPGVLRTNVGGAMSKTTASNAMPIVLGSGELTIVWVLKVNATSSNNIYVGISDGLFGSEAANGVYFNYASGTNSGNWVGKTSASSSRTSADSAVAVSGGTWVRLKIVVNAAATSVSFYIDDVEIANSPITTNIPTTAIAPFISRESTTPVVDIDLFTLKYVLTTTR